MTPHEIVSACAAKGVALRITEDKRLVGNPNPTRKLDPDLLKAIRDNRAALIDFLESEIEAEIPDVAPPEPPKPSIAESMIAAFAQRGIKITLDHPGPWGMLKVITEWEDGERVGADAMEAISGVRARNRKQIPHDLRSPLENFKRELLDHLRSKHRPAPADMPTGHLPSERSIWERMAHPDNLIPGAADNQRHVRELLYGPAAASMHEVRRQQQLEAALPAVLSSIKRRK